MKRIHSVIGKRKPKNKPDEFIVGNNIGIDDVSATPTNRSFHFSPKIFSAISVFIALFGVYTIFFSQAATPTMANLWVAPGGSANCTRSASPTSYSSGGSNVCDSINTAWGKCQNSSNDTVVIKPYTGGGVYPNQSISGDKTGLGCKIIGEDGTNIGVLNINANYFWLENVTIEAPDTHVSGGMGISSDNVTLKNVNVHGDYATIDIGSVSDLLWQGGELGEAGKVGGKRRVGCSGGPAGDPEPIQMGGTTRVTFDGIKFHPQDADLTPVSCSSNGYHLEMIRVEGGNDYFTIRNSTFDSGDHSGTASIFITTSSPGGAAANHLLFENNFFGDVDASSGAFSVHSNVTTCSNYTFAYNTFLSSTGAFQCANMVNNKWVGNLGSNFFDAAKPCPAITSVIYTNNVWQDDYINYSGNKNCGTDGVTPGFGGTNPGADTLVQGTRYSTNALGLGGADGFRLQAGSKAIDKGERVGGYCTTTLGSRDHDNGERPVPAGGRCDAGAHEYGSTPRGGSSDTTAPTVSITAPSAGSMVTGSMTVSANASDNVGITGVQFKLDGTNIGSEDGTSPYSIIWDSTGVANGSHTLTAVARDAAGNSITSAGVQVTVNNTATSNTLYISTLGTDANTCSQASPCRTIGGAYAKSATTPGSTIIINAGTYGNDTIAYKANMSGGDVNNPKQVIVKPASGATVNFTDISERAEYITFQGPNFNARSFDVGCDTGGCTRIKNVIIDGLNINAQDTLNLDAMYITNITGLTLKNSRVGNTMAGSGGSDTAKSVMFCGGSATCMAENVLFEGNTFYDADAPTGSAAHLECIFATGIQGFTVRKNRFQDCTYFDIFITVQLVNNQPQPKDYIIEDNLLGRTVGVDGSPAGYNIDIHNDVKPNNIKFLRNTIEGAIATANGGGAIQSQGWEISGNIISEGVWLSDPEPMGCRSGITFTYNVMPNTCGTNTTTATTSAIKAGWVSQKNPYAGEDDFRLLATSPAVNKGKPADAGTVDFAGTTRTNPPDAGAYEYTSGGSSSCSTKPGDTNNDSVVNITDIAEILKLYGQTNSTSCVDVNKDAVINISDIATVLQNYGK